jgi:NADPH:quinone reductase-like Zn-dependent oxidoreductase
LKAVRLYEYGGPEKLKFEDNVPDPKLGADSVLVESFATSVNPVDWKIRSGARQKDFPRQLPTILGRDVSGVVRSVGSNVRTFKPGDRVLALTEATYAQLVAVEGSILTHLPDGVDLVDSAAIPLVSLTGDQLVRLATRAQSGQTLVVTGALGSAGRAAVHTAHKLGAQVIAGVRASQLAQARALGTLDVVALDDDAAIAALPMVDGVADTVGGDTAAKLLNKVKNGGYFGYASVLPDGAFKLNPAVTITRVFARPDASKVREFADDIRDGKFILPISHRLPLRDAGEAQALLQKGGAGGKILLLCRGDEASPSLSR